MNYRPENNPLAFLLESAPAHLQGPILDRLDPRSRRDMLDGAPLPATALLLHALTRADPAETALLASHLHATPEVLLAIATDTVDPSMAALLFRHERATREVRLRVMRAIPSAELLDRDGWWDAGELREELLQRCLGAAVEHDDPAVVTEALALLRPGVNQSGAHAVALRGCLQLLDLAGPQAVHDAKPLLPFTMDRELGWPRWKPDDIVIRALDAPTDRALLVRALAYLSSTPVMIDRIRFALDGVFLGLLLDSPRGPLDWDAIMRAHHERRFRSDSVSSLMKELGCPEELAEWHDDVVPPPFGNSGTDAAALPEMRLASLPRVVERFAVAHREGRLPTATILGEGAPARYALGVFQVPRVSPRRLRRQARVAIAEAALRTLGDSVDAWVVALNLLPEFPGTLLELFTTATAATA